MIAAQLEQGLKNCITCISEPLECIPRKGGPTPIEGMGERSARKMHKSCSMGALEMKGSFKGRCGEYVIPFS